MSRASFGLVVVLLISAFLGSCRDAEIGKIWLTLHPFEQLATRNGPKIVVSINGKPAGELNANAPDLLVSLPSEKKFDFAYVGPSGELTDVSWSQTVKPDEQKLVVMQPWRRPDREHRWQIIAWARPEDSRRVLKHLQERKVVTVVSPILWGIDDQGAVNTYAGGETIERLRSYDIHVWPAIHGMNANGLHVALASDFLRSQLARRLSLEARNFGADGINVDVEGYRSEDSEAVVAFVEELAALVHRWGGVISYDVVARSDSWHTAPLPHWSDAPQRRRLAASVDYTILMAYDQFNSHRPAGPVAAPNWVKSVLTYQLRYADPQSILLGIPAYGLLWNPDALDLPRGVSLSHLDGGDGVHTFDKTHCVDRIDRPDRLFYWAEKSLTDHRVRLARDYQLGGVAIWRFGLDYPELWHAAQVSESHAVSLLDDLMTFLWGPGLPQEQPELCAVG